jgi:6-phosphogluconolactonase
VFAHVGTFTTWDEQPSEGIYSFAVEEDGALTPVSVTPVPDPSFLAASERGTLYAATHSSHFEGEPGAGLVAFAVAEDGTLRRLGHARVPSPHPVHLSVHRDHVLVASGLGGAASAYPIGGDGVPGAVSGVLPFGDEPSVRLGERTRLPRVPTPGAPHPHCIVASPDGGFVLVADMNRSRVHVLALDGGTLRPHAVEPSPPGSDAGGARHLAFHGEVLYVLNESHSSISAFGWEPGALRHVQTVSTLPAPGPSKAADLHVHPSGRFLYASNRGHDSLAAFAIEADGRLRALGYAPTGDGPRGFALTPDGALLLVASQNAGDVRAYRVDPDSGALRPTGARTAVPCPVCICLTDERRTHAPPRSAAPPR